MATLLELSLMAGGAYVSTRAEINRMPTPDKWSKLIGDPDKATGFEAVTFVREGSTLQTSPEIVISYSGTDPNNFSIFTSPDGKTNVNLNSGRWAEQLLQAATYYLDIKAANPTASITFTGHSLGGGLAALMAVFFGQKALTFDQAPFAKSALALTDGVDSVGNPITADNASMLAQRLAALTTTQGGQTVAKYDAAALSALTEYLQLRAANSSKSYIPREQELIQSLRIEGEFLDKGPLSGRTMGQVLPSLSHGPAEWTGASFDLHSQALLTALLQSQKTATPSNTLNEVSKSLPPLLQMLFDKNLFTFNAASADSNFLDRIVRHEAGVAANDAAGAAMKSDAMVTRFTKDLWKLAQGGLTQSDGNSSNAALAEVSKTLIAFAMQKYYTETASSKGYAKELFTSLTGGVSFDRSDVAATWAEAKGKQYFDAYLQQNSTGLSKAERDVMAAQLTDITQWFVQAGSEGMRASAGPQRSFMLGGKTDDVLSGGDAADLLLGNAGSDSLKGGSGEDVYIFGARHGADVIDDTQGKTGVFTGGRPYKEERPVGAGQNDLILKFDGGDQITIKNYFGNAQTENRSASYVGEDYELHYGDSLEAFASVVQRLVWQGDGDGNTMTGLSDYANRIESGGGADVLTGGDLDDTLNGGAGEDTYYADAGDFVVDGDGAGAVYFGGRVTNFGHSRIALKTAK